MHIPDLFIVGSETLPGLAFGWSATQAYFRTCCCHFVCPFLCFDYLERVLGGAKNVVRLPPAIEILPETHCGCRPHGIWGGSFFSSFTLPPPSTTSSGHRQTSRVVASIDNARYSPSGECLFPLVWALFC